jgi:hypothetical protein
MTLLLCSIKSYRLTWYSESIGVLASGYQLNQKLTLKLGVKLLT